MTKFIIAWAIMLVIAVTLSWVERRDRRRIVDEYNRLKEQSDKKLAEYEARNRESAS